MPTYYDDNIHFRNKWSKKLWRFFIRLIIYQIVILWILLKCTNFSKHSIQLKNHVYSALEAFDTTSKLVDEIFIHPQLATKLITALEAILVLFALTGNKSCGVYLAFINIFTSLIYYNPFLKVNLENHYFGVSQDLLLGVACALAMLVCSMRPHCCEAINDWNPWEYQNEEEDNDEEIEENLASYTQTQGNKVKDQKVIKKNESWTAYADYDSVINKSKLILNSNIYEHH